MQHARVFRTLGSELKVYSWWFSLIPKLIASNTSVFEHVYALMPYLFCCGMLSTLSSARAVFTFFFASSFLSFLLSFYCIPVVPVTLFLSMPNIHIKANEKEKKINSGNFFVACCPDKQIAGNTDERNRRLKRCLQWNKTQIGQVPISFAVFVMIVCGNEWMYEKTCIGKKQNGKQWDMIFKVWVRRMSKMESENERTAIVI